jgi:ribosomal protein L44E
MFPPGGPKSFTHSEGQKVSPTCLQIPRPTPLFLPVTVFTIDNRHRGTQWPFTLIGIMDVWEVLCRPPWADQASKEIARTLGYDRKTIRRYIRIAVEKGLSREALLPPRQEVESFPWRLSMARYRRTRKGYRQFREPYLPEITALVSKVDLTLKCQDCLRCPLSTARHRQAKCVLRLHRHTLETAGSSMSNSHSPKTK